MPKTKSPGKPGARSKEYVCINFRLPKEVVDMIDRYVAEDNSGKDIPTSTRGSMFKQILQYGLDVMKKNHLDGNGSTGS